MLRKAFLSCVLLIFVFLGSGCGTLSKGAQGLKEGAKEDWAWLDKTVKKTDGWIKANLW